MEDTPNKSIKEVAFKILSARWQSSKEVEKRLKEKGFENHEIEETIGFLEERGYIDDKKLGHHWAKYRLENRSYGLIRISYELQRKGVDKKTISLITNRLRDEFNEREIAMVAGQKKVKGLQRSPSTLRKIYGYLMRKGFSTEIVRDVMDNLEWE